MPLTDQDTGASVPRMHGGAGDNQISDAGQSADCFPFSAHSRSKPGNLRNASRNQRRFRIIAIAESVRNAGRKRNHVFQRRPQLDAQHVRTDIDTKNFVHKNILQIFRRIFFSGSDNNRRRDASSYLFCMGGA